MKLLQLQVDNETGLPPKRPALTREAERLRELQAVAQRAQSLWAAAQQQSRYRLEIVGAGPAEIAAEVNRCLGVLADMEAYALVVEEISETLKKAETASASAQERAWSKAVRRIEEFLVDLTDPTRAAAFRLLAVLKLGLQAQKHRLNYADEKRCLTELRRIERSHRDPRSGFTHPLLRPHSLHVQELEERLEGPERAQFEQMLLATELLCDWSENSDRAGAVSPLAVPTLADRGAVAALAKVLQEYRDERGAAGRRPRLEQLQRWREKFIEAAGPNYPTLLAGMGDVEATFAHIRGTPPSAAHLPHNLAVAIVQTLRRHGSLPAADVEQYLAVLMGTAALLAGDRLYRAALAPHLALDSLGLDDAQLKPRTAAELEEAFHQLNVPWGDRNDPNSWACRWEAEYFAVFLTRSKLREEDALKLPLGPALIKFFGLEDALEEVLVRQPNLRRLYGPCAAAEALRWVGELDRAHRLFAAVRKTAFDEIAQHPGYARLADPAACLRQDALRGGCAVRVRMLRRDLLGQQSAMARSGADVDALDQGGNEFFNALEKLESCEDLCHDFVEFAKDLAKQVIDELAHPQNYGGQAKPTVSDGELRYQLIDKLVTLLEQRLACWRGESGEAAALPADERAARLFQQFVSTQAKESRASILYDYIFLLAKRWYVLQRENAPHEELAQRIDAMYALAQQMLQDSKLPHAYVGHAEVWLMKLDFDGEAGLRREEIEGYFQELLDKAIRLSWPRRASERLEELLQRLRFGE